MIKKIMIENFKVFKSLSLEVSNLNLLTGLNGMGKSTLIQAMLLLRQSYQKSGREPMLYLNDDSLVNLGTVKDILAWEGDGKSISFSIFDEKYTLSIKAIRDGETSDDTMPLDNNFDFADKFSLFTDNFQYLNANRITPDDSFKLSNTNIKKGQLGRIGEYTAHFLLENGTKNIPLKALCHESERTKSKPIYALQYQVEKWLGEITPNPLQIKPIQIGNSIDIRYYNDENPSTERTRINEGFGITYVLGVLTALLSAKEGDLVIIENPEAHLHAKGQSKLAELMCLAAQNGVQIFCETHSDHIFYGVCVALNEGKIKEDALHTYYFQKEKQVSVAIPIKINKRGRIVGSEPQGFFDQYAINLDKLL